VNNGPCSATTTVNIEFFETPVPSISGASTVFSCSEETYTVTDGRVCQYGTPEYIWKVTAGIFTVNGLTTATGSSVDVQWDNTLTAGTLTVTASVQGLPSCSATSQVFTVAKQAPTLAGQVKYWNQFETEMPTPFPTNFYGTYPHDYFYVTLYRKGTTLDSLQTVKVEPRLHPDLNEIISYFKFDIPIESDGCGTEYLLKVWDGGLSYHKLTGGAPVPPVSGTYLGEAFTYNNWGGVNATDALSIQLMVGGAHALNQPPYNFQWLGDNTLNPPYGYFSHSIADVNSSKPYAFGGITALDALTTNYRVVGLIHSFPNSTPGVQFSPNFRVTGRMVPQIPYVTWPMPFDWPTSVSHEDDVPFYHSGVSYLYFTGAEQHKYASTVLPLGSKNNYINIYYSALGDINASYVPEATNLKSGNGPSLIIDRTKPVAKGMITEVPIRVGSSVHLGALTMGLRFRNDLIEITGSNYGPDFININQGEGTVKIGWYSPEGVLLGDDEAVVVLQVRILADLTAQDILLELDNTTEFADIYAGVIHGVELKSTALVTGRETAGELTATNYPNPFNVSTRISYSLPGDGNVQIEVFNKLGQVVTRLVDAYQEEGVHQVELSGDALAPGIYYYRITLVTKDQTFTVTRNMIVVR
jgi:hypothetical protein